jgi:hypothetical protein
VADAGFAPRQSAHANGRLGNRNANVSHEMRETVQPWSPPGVGNRKANVFHQTAPTDRYGIKGIANALREAARLGGDDATIPDRLEFGARHQAGLR